LQHLHAFPKPGQVFIQKFQVAVHAFNGFKKAIAKP